MPPQKAPIEPAIEMKLSSFRILEENFLKLAKTEYPITKCVRDQIDYIRRT